MSTPSPTELVQVYPISVHDSGLTQIDNPVVLIGFKASIDR